MPQYVVLMDWTEQGIKGFKHSVESLQKDRKAFEAKGVRIKDAYYTMGPHDMVIVVEAPGDEVFNGLMLELGAQGNVRTLSMKAWTPEEFARMVGK